jgi:DNA-binding NarL/FixJ family response regulator
MSSGNYSVILADNQFLVFGTIVELINKSEFLTLTGLAQNYEELYALLNEYPHIDLLITDNNLIDYSGGDKLIEIQRTHPKIRILILTNQIKVNDIHELSKLGIKNILFKTATYEEIMEAIHHTIQGKRYYTESILDLLIEYKVNRDEATVSNLLTPTEIEITRMIATGRTSKEIAVAKHISFHTVMSHRKNIFRKTNIKNTSELVIYAIKAGLIDNIEYNI